MPWSGQDVALLSQDERAELIATLVDLQRTDESVRLSRFRLLFLATMLFAAAGLAAWVVYLLGSLPATHNDRAWRIAWVGFDFAEIVAVLITAWAAWRDRQLVILACTVTGTLLLCDAWFDVALSWGSSGWWLSVLLALLVEVPAALSLWATVRFAIRIRVRELRASFGVRTELPPFRRMLWAAGPFDGTPPGHSVTTY